MKCILKKHIITLIAIAFLFPFSVFAQADNQICSPVGYSIFTINGIFTDENEAKKNKDELKKRVPPTFNSQPLTVDFLHNPSHLAGLGDIAMSVYQKIFDSGTVEDYDLIEMLKTASEKVKTQKLLIVAHSQGNFYANSFYDTVAGKEGGVPEESIGVYSVATPAGRVAGGGKWLTSDTDKVIAGIVSRAPFKKIMSPNTSIVLNDEDDPLGHNFKNIYLKYRGKEIVLGIKESLDKLKEKPNQDQLKNCIDPPKLTLSHKVAGVFLNSADLAINTSVKTAVVVKKEVYDAGVAVVNTAKEVAVGVGTLAKESLSLLKLKSADISGNPASAISAIGTTKTDTKEKDGNVAVVSSESDNNTSDQEKIIVIQRSLEDIKNQVVVLEQRKFINDNIPKPPPGKEDKKSSTEKPNTPRLLFIGTTYPGFGGGGEVAQIQTATIDQPSEEPVQSVQEETLSVPVLIATQCSYSLASDGCLLATTTVVFSWQSVPLATYYAISRNGEYSTTTDLSFSADIPDFSSYVFSVSAGNISTTSATSTQTVSVATIPIAINEIAWMGTTASSYDEWLELKNNTGHRINLSQWAIESADNLPYIALVGEMSPHEYRILERRANTITANSVISVYGNGSSQWALGNNGEELVLSYASTTLDKSPAIIGNAWTAGGNTSSTTRKTMERINSKQSGATSTNWTTWGANIDFIKNGNDTDGNKISGTPGECNSANYSNINNGQNITSDLTLTKNDCYYTSAGVSISATSSLVIEEGVRISLYQNNLVVDGVIIAVGTTDNPIIIDSFTGTPTSNRIRISGANGTSTMDNIAFSNTGGIYLNNSASLEVSSAEFANNQYGIELNNNSSVVIENSNFASTTGEAVSAYNGSSILISSSTISNAIDSDAIGIYHSNFTMSSTTIDTAYDGDGIGIYDSNVSITNSTISNIYDGNGISAYDSIATISNSTVSNVYDGDGIGLYHSTTTMSGVVVENVSDDGIAVYGGSAVGDAVVDGVKW